MDLGPTALGGNGGNLLGARVAAVVLSATLASCAAGVEPPHMPPPDTVLRTAVQRSYAGGVGAIRHVEIVVVRFESIAGADRHLDWLDAASADT